MFAQWAAQGGFSIPPLQWTQPFFPIKLRGRAISLTSCPRHEHATLAVQSMPIHVTCQFSVHGVHARVYNLKPSLPGSWREKMSQGYTPWISWARHHEGKQLHILNKQKQRSHRVNAMKQFLKMVCKVFFYLFIYILNGTRQKIERQKCH